MSPAVLAVLGVATPAALIGYRIHAVRVRETQPHPEMAVAIEADPEADELQLVVRNAGNAVATRVNIRFPGLLIETMAALKVPERYLEGRDCDGMTVSTVNLHPCQEVRLPLCPLKQAGELAQRLAGFKNPLVVWATCRGGVKRLEWYTTEFEVIIPEETLNHHKPTGS